MVVGWPKGGGEGGEKSEGVKGDESQRGGKQGSAFELESHGRRPEEGRRTPNEASSKVDTVEIVLLSVHVSADERTKPVTTSQSKTKNA
jgi:hypothetical protein